MAAPKEVMSGEHSAVRVFVDDQPQGTASDICKTWKISEVAVMHRDQYAGQSRARTDKQLTGYDMSIEMDMADSALLDALLAQQATRDAHLPVKPITVAVTFFNRDGASQTYAVTNVTSKLELNMSGREERIGQSFELQGEDLVKIA